MNDKVSNIIYWLKKFFNWGKFRFLDTPVQTCVRGDMFGIDCTVQYGLIITLIRV